MPDSIVGVDFDYTYNGRLSTEVLFKPSIDTPPIDLMMRVIPGQKYKAQLPTSPVLSKILKEYTNCARTFTDGIDLDNVTITLSPLEVNMEWCKDDFEGSVGNILAEEFLRTGVDEFNPEGTEIQTIIDRLVDDAVRRDVFRVLSFCDASDPNADYNQMDTDGLWPKLIADAVGGASYCVNRAVTFPTGDLSSGEALAALEEIYTKSAIILKQIPITNKAMYVTGSVFENLLASYESNTTGSDDQFTLLKMGPEIVAGVPTLTYRGISVIPLYAWDSSLEDADNPLFGTVKHLVLYTTRDNHGVGVDVLADNEGQISGWYERKDRKYYIEGFMRMGYNYIHCELQTVGY